MAAMIDQNWVENREIKAENKGRPVKIYRLSRPIGEITDRLRRRNAKKPTCSLHHSTDTDLPPVKSRDTPHYLTPINNPLPLFPKGAGES